MNTTEGCQYLPTSTITTGTITTSLEIDKHGRIQILCPCCRGAGEHDSLPGNNPHNHAYPCRTCQGSGDIDHEFRERQFRKPPPRTNPHWPGCPITPSLTLKPQDRNWTIESSSNAPTTITTPELAHLAHTILENLEDVQQLNQYDWLRQYLRLNTRATTQKAMLAWDREHPQNWNKPQPRLKPAPQWLVNSGRWMDLITIPYPLTGGEQMNPGRVNMMDISSPTDIQAFREVLRERRPTGTITPLWPPGWEEEWNLEDILQMAAQYLGRPGLHVQLAVRERMGTRNTADGPTGDLQILLHLRYPHHPDIRTLIVHQELLEDRMAAINELEEDYQNSIAP